MHPYFPVLHNIISRFPQLKKKPVLVALARQFLRDVGKVLLLQNILRVVLLPQQLMFHGSFYSRDVFCGPFSPSMFIESRYTLTTISVGLIMFSKGRFIPVTIAQGCFPGAILLLGLDFTLLYQPQIPNLRQAVSSSKRV